MAVTNLYLRDRKPPNAVLLFNIASYITKLLKLFGAITENVQIGFPVSKTNETNLEEAVMPYLSILSDFRDKIRIEAKSTKAFEILKVCDSLRDEILPNVGVRLEDREGQSSAVKLMDRETLLKEKEAKKQAELEKQAEKERKKAELLAAQAAKEAQRKIPPSEMFKTETDKYSKFDENVSK